MKKNSTDTTVSEPGMPRTLAVDIGGTGIKTIILDPDGKAINLAPRAPLMDSAQPRDRRGRRFA